MVVALVGARANFDGLHGGTETCVCQAVTNENGKYAVRVGRRAKVSRDSVRIEQEKRSESCQGFLIGEL